MKVLAFLLLGLLGCASTPQPPHLYRVIVPVHDIDRAAAFYGAILEDQGQRISGGRHYFDCGGTILACFSPAGDGDAHTLQPIPEWIYLAVDDVHAARERCAAADGKFEPGRMDGGGAAGEVVLRPWGELSFYVRDPFGNGLCFVERSTRFTGAR